jgi:hypothetical protein
MAGRQIDGFEKINWLCHSLADFAHAGWANGSPGTCQNQEQLGGSWPIGTFARVYEVTDRRRERRLWHSSIFSTLWPMGREYQVQPPSDSSQSKAIQSTKASRKCTATLANRKYLSGAQLVSGF